MSENRGRILIIGSIIGALLGFGVAWIAYDARNEERQLSGEGAKVRIKPGARDWVAFAAAAIALARQFSNMIEPKVE